MLDTLDQSTEHPAAVQEADWRTSFSPVGSWETAGEFGFPNCVLSVSIVDCAPV